MIKHKMFKQKYVIGPCDNLQEASNLYLITFHQHYSLKNS